VIGAFPATFDPEVLVTLGKNKPGSAQFTSRLLQIGYHHHNVAIIMVTLS